DQSQSLNTIGSGEFLTSLMYLSESELLAAGYDLNRFDGEHTIAFKFDKSGICDRGYCTSVPEPSAGLGLAALGLMIGVRYLRQRYSA
ncbi:MAG: PEP-CTERM sorting domain-containing protein, partial [Coleofasciculus sp. C2-GNP5-27]